MSFPELSAKSPYTGAVHLQGAPSSEKASESEAPHASKTQPGSGRPQTLDDRSFLIVAQAVTSQKDVKAFSDSVKLTPFAKFKEFLGLEGATAKVLHSAKALHGELDHLKESLLMEDAHMGAHSVSAFEHRAQHVVDGAKKLSASLTGWLAKHDNDPASAPKGPHKDQIRAFRDELKTVNSFIDGVVTQAPEGQLKSALFSKPLPKDFPIDDVPRFKEMMIAHATGEAIKAAKSPDSFLRGSEIAAFTSVMKASVVTHFSKEISDARETSKNHALEEVGKSDKTTTSDQLKNPEIRNRIAQDYQALITAMLGPTTDSAKDAALRLPDGTIEMTRQLKQGLDQAVLDGKLSPQEAKDATRLLVVNNFVLRSINPQFIESYSHPDQKLDTAMLNRTNGLSVMLQQHANGVPFGAKQPHLQELNISLAAEKEKVNAFIDAITTRL